MNNQHPGLEVSAIFFIFVLPTVLLTLSTLLIILKPSNILLGVGGLIFSVISLIVVWHILYKSPSRTNRNKPTEKE